jgi:hypothetical protein
MNDILAVLFGVLVSVPVALVVVAAMRQPRDVIDFTGWAPPDESTETPETALYFDAQWREVAP